MSKAIVIPAGNPLFIASRTKTGAFRKPVVSAAPEFNTHNDPLIYRDNLPKPDSLILGTGFGFIDTSVLLIHEKSGDPSSPIRGFKFVSQGVQFQIEKPNVPGMKPQYAITVLTSDKKPITEAKYRMTPSDVWYALTCLKHEHNMGQSELQNLAALFDKEGPATNPVRLKASHSIEPNGARKFKFSEYGKTYSVNIFPTLSSLPTFAVDGYLPNNTPFTRTMTEFEIGYTINRIASGLSLDDSVRFNQDIVRMRSYQQGLQGLTVTGEGKNTSSRSMNFFGS